MLEDISDPRNGNSFWWNPFSGPGQEIAFPELCLEHYLFSRNLTENLEINLRFQNEQILYEW